MGLPPGNEQQSLKQLKIVNKPSSDWEENLREAIVAQGGEAFQEVKMNRNDSFIWAQNGIGIFVESVTVNLRNARNEESAFNVLVDSQTGKILQNWGTPVRDPLNPRAEFRVKLDPRYTE
jgi:hypothetical protein